MNAAPYFIVLDGIDGSGTTSQSRALAQALAQRGHRVHETREPSSGVIGRLIRERLAVDAEQFDRAALALLFAADRLDHMRSEIEPRLARGEVVVCDRYVMSSWAYQSLDVPLDWVKEINRHARWPDLTLFLDVEPDEAMRRVRGRQAELGSAPEFYEVPLLQRRLALAYRELAADPRHDAIVYIDGHLDVAAVTASILAACVEAGL